jgi:beta-mannosidase
LRVDHGGKPKPHAERHELAGEGHRREEQLQQEASQHADADLLHGADPRRTLAVFDLLADGRRLSRHLLYFQRAVDLALPDPQIQATLRRDTHGLVLDLQAQHFARAVWIDFGDRDATLSDNDVDLLPGEHVALRVMSHDTLDTLRRTMRLRSLVDATLPHGTTP